MEKVDIINNVFNTLRFKGIVKNQKEFAQLLGCDTSQMSRALKGDPKGLSDNIVEKAQQYMDKVEMDEMFPSIADTKPSQRTPTLPVIPVDAMAGTLGEFSSQVSEYDCERMVSPIAGAEYAMKVCGDSMSPEYPSGSIVLIKRINENAFIEWGKVYVLDTENGAVIKQIRKTDKDDVVECVSLNPTYQPFNVNTSYINGWYRVLMVMSQK